MLWFRQRSQKWNSKISYKFITFEKKKKSILSWHSHQRESEIKALHWKEIVWLQTGLLCWFFQFCLYYRLSMAKTWKQSWSMLIHTFKCCSIPVPASSFSLFSLVLASVMVSSFYQYSHLIWEEKEKGFMQTDMTCAMLSPVSQKPGPSLSADMQPFCS